MVEFGQIASIVVLARNLLSGDRKAVEFADFFFLRFFETIGERVLHFFF